MFASIKKRISKTLNLAVAKAFRHFVLNNQAMMEGLYAIAEVRLASDIPLKLRLMALESTAVYVQKEMQAAKTFETTGSLWEFALCQATQTGLFLEFGVFKGESINIF